MKTALLAFALLATGCMHGHCMHGGDDAMMMRPPQMGDSMPEGMGRRRADVWPTVRIDEPVGAMVTMERGVFGDGIHVATPFQGSFQPTSIFVQGGYPLAFDLDAGAAHRYGEPKATRIYGRLLVARSMKKRGVLRIAPSDCQLKALMSGDIDELRIPADELPTADEACAIVASCAMHDHGEGHGMLGHAMADHHAPNAHPEADMHEGCNHPGNACGHEHGGCGQHQPAAMLVLRATKF